MKVLVTGANGFLGSHVVETLRYEGHQVKAMVRTVKPYEHIRENELIKASLEDPESLKKAVDQIDAVVHCAGLVKAKNKQEFFEVNEHGTKNLLDAIEKHCPHIQRFVLVSSLAAFGFGENGPRPKDASPNPLTHYGASKLAGEKEVISRKDKFPVTILRPPAIYGPKDTEMFSFFKMIASHIKIFIGSPENHLSLIYVTDCAQAIEKIVSQPHGSGSIYFVEDGKMHSQKEFVRIVEKQLGIDAHRIPIPGWFFYFAALLSEGFGKLTGKAMMFNRNKLKELKHPWLVCNSSDFQEDFGWKPSVKLEQGVQLAVEWYKEHGWLK